MFMSQVMELSSGAMLNFFSFPDVEGQTAESMVTSFEKTRDQSSTVLIQDGGVTKARCG